jgi:hypothetical protein
MNYYFGEESITLEEAVVKYKLSKTYIKKLIDNKYIHATDLTKYGGRGIMIDLESRQRLRMLSEHPEYKQKVLDFNPSSYYDFCPEIMEYHLFHDFIDRYCWLIKLFYIDKEDIKKKKYRLDVLFQNFLVKNNFSIEKLTETVAEGNGNNDKVVFHLQKGWYNELVRSIPLNESYLQIGTKVKGSVADATSVSWNITQTYYSIYEYTNSLDYLFSKTIDTKQHRKPTNIFNNSVLNKLKKDVLFYPFSLSSKNVGPRKYPKHMDFGYASYPRDTSKNIQDVNKDVIKALKLLSKENKGRPVCLVDFLYEFRVWANYTGMQTITKLENGYLLDYLYKNLGILNFFVGGMSELSALAKLGEKEYLKVFNTFVDDYVLKQPHFEENLLLVPIFIRHRIYYHLGILTSIPPFLSSIYKDPVKLVVPDIKKDKTKDNKENETKMMVKLSKMSIKEIAKFIIDDWGKTSKVPRHYLEPMLEIETLDEMYYADTAYSVVAYFVSSASGWKGFNARVTKKYLKELLEKHSKRK